MVLLSIVAYQTCADSPITSTDFYRAYLDYPIVQKAEQEGVIDIEIAEYLYSRSIPIDLKVAVMNALSWGPEEKRNADFFTYYLALRYRTPTDHLHPRWLLPTELFCLGYLTILDNYFEPSHGRILMELAIDQMAPSFAASLVYGLALAQELSIDGDYASSWNVIEKVLTDQALPQDFRPEAIEIVVEYMRLYE